MYPRSLLARDGWVPDVDVIVAALDHEMRALRRAATENDRHLELVDAV